MNTPEKRVVMPITPQLTEHRASVRGIELELWSGGEGRPVLFLHPGDGFDPHADFARRLAMRHTVLAPLHPGFGASQLPEHFSTVDDLAYFYLDFLEARDIKDAVILGVSFGAWIAAEMAIKNTQRIAGLVLVDALGAKFRDRQTREISDLFALNIFDQARLIYHDEARRNRRFADTSEEELRRLARAHESFALYGWSPTLHDPKLAHRLHRIGAPTLVAWGEHDRVVSPEYGREFASRIPGARFELIHGAGHYPHIEQPERFDSVLGRFAAERSAAKL